MNFLNPLILFGLGAAFLPLVIHLLSKRRAKEVVFPSISLLKMMQTDRIRMLKLKQLILLLLRTLIIILIILAFARPTLRSIFRENARTTAVIIIDSSASMLYVDNGELLFDRTLRKGKEILNLLRKDDMAAVIFSGTIPTILSQGLTKDKKRLVNALEDCENSLSSGNPEQSFKMVVDLLERSGALNKEIYYVTDGAANSLPDSLTVSDKNIRLYTVLLGPEEREGSVIEDIRLVDKLLAPGNEITFKVRGYFGAGAQEMNIEFFINGERKGRSQVSKSSSGYVEADFGYTPEVHGWYSVYAAVDDGYFEPGEKRRIAIQVPEKKNVLLAGGSTEDMYFIEKVLDPGQEYTMFSVKSLLQGDISKSDISMADVIILSGVTDLSEELYTSLVTAVTERGKGLMVFPGKDIGSSFYGNGIFRDIMPMKVEKQVVSQKQDKSNYMYIERFDFTHPILKGVSKEGTISKPEVMSYYTMSPSPDVHVLARFSDNSMAVGEIACGKGKAIVCAVNAFEDSDFPLSGIFVPFFIRSAQYLSGIIINGGLYETGDTITETIGDIPQNVQVMVKPENSPAKFVDIAFVDGRALTKDVTAGSPGFYSVYTGNEERKRYSVNVPVSEIQFKRYGTKSSSEAFKNIHWKEIDDSENLTEFVIKDRYGRELTGIFILCTMVLLCVEMVIARKL